MNNTVVDFFDTQFKFRNSLFKFKHVPMTWVNFLNPKIKNFLPGFDQNFWFVGKWRENIPVF